jgi:hypothetical protein
VAPFPQLGILKPCWSKELNLISPVLNQLEVGEGEAQRSTTMCGVAVDCDHLSLPLDDVCSQSVDLADGDALALELVDDVNMELPALDLLAACQKLSEEELSNLQEALHLAACEPCNGDASLECVLLKHEVLLNKAKLVGGNLISANDVGALCKAGLSREVIKLPELGVDLVLQIVLDASVAQVAL